MTDGELFDIWKSLNRHVFQMFGARLGDDGKSALGQLIETIENPAASVQEPPTELNTALDPMEWWAAGRKDPAEFRPSLVLWEDYRAWCVRAGERPGTLTDFYAELKKRTWLRKGRTPDSCGMPRNGWWGLRI